MTKRFRKLPVEIEALQWDGINTVAMSEFTGVPLDDISSAPFVNRLRIKTLEGTMTASVGDWIIRGVQDEFYRCKPDIFAATYEPVPTPAAGEGE